MASKKVGAGSGDGDSDDVPDFGDVDLDFLRPVVSAGGFAEYVPRGVADFFFAAGCRRYTLAIIIAGVLGCAISIAAQVEVC